MLIALIAMTAIMIMGAAFMRLELNTKSATDSALDRDRAFYLAEAAIAESGAAILTGRNGAIASQGLPARFGNGLFWVTSTNLGGGNYQLDATAMSNSGRAALRTVVHKTEIINFDAALKGDTSVVSSPNNILVDSYDPSLGSYAVQPKRLVPPGTVPIVNTKGDVRSNGNVTITTNDEYYGNVHPGPGKSVGPSPFPSGAFIYGSTAPATSTFTLPAVTVPSIASAGARTVNSADPVASRTVLPGSYHWSSLTVNNAAVLTIRGPSTIVLDSFMTRTGSKVLIDGTGGPVNIYFTGTATFDDNLTWTATGPSARSGVSMYFTSNIPVVFASSGSDVVGTIYAPNTTIDFTSNWRIYGAVVAKTVLLSSNIAVHYDESLSLTGRAAFPTLTVSSWFKRALPLAAWAHKRYDPFALLGVQKADCPNPANAWN